MTDKEILEWCGLKFDETFRFWGKRKDDGIVEVDLGRVPILDMQFFFDYVAGKVTAYRIEKFYSYEEGELKEFVRVRLSYFDKWYSGKNPSPVEAWKEALSKLVKGS